MNFMIKLYVYVSYGKSCFSTYSRKVKFERSHSISESSSEVSIIGLFINFLLICPVIYLFGNYLTLRLPD